jgi:MFS family permease
VFSVEFAGNFACLILLYFLSFSIAALLRIQRLDRVSREHGGRPLRAIAGQRAYLVAVLSAMVGNGAMNFIMIATPLAMQSYAHSFPQTAFVIQWHILGMFVPSFFTGHLIQRFGTANVMLVGILFVALCIGMNISGTSVRHFWIGLIFLFSSVQRRCSLKPIPVLKSPKLRPSMISWYLGLLP